MTLRHGYFTGAGYTFGAYSEPSPERLALVALLHSHRPADLAGPFRLLELGCGQGFHLCLQAANYSQAQFLGVDFHAEHIAHARSLAAAAGISNIQFQQADFLDLAANPGELQEGFDLVVAHGILGWVSPAVGSALLQLAAAALRPGGLLYLSYNTLPGWLAPHAFQHAVHSLQALHGDGLPALEAARNLFSGLKEAQSQLFNAQPGLASRLEGMAGMDPAYLLHEYNHSQWQPLYSNQVIEPAQALGLSFLGSASLAENFDGLLPEPFRKQLKQQQDPILKELVRDLLTNQSFRRDVFAKGRDPLWSLEALASIDALRLQRLADSQALAEEQAFQFQLGFGEIQGNRDWFQSLLAGFGDQPLSLAALRAQQPATDLPELLQNLSLLISKGFLALVPPERDPQLAQRLNAHIASRVAAGAPYRSLACPTSGNIHSLSDIDLFAIHALQQGHPQTALAEAIDASLQQLDRQPLRDGQPLAGSEHQEALEQMAETFRQRTLPLLRRLGVLT